MMDLDLSNFVFDKKNHRYTLAGEVIPSVTTVLGVWRPIPNFMLFEDSFVLACQFGTFVHEATEADDLGRERDPEIVGGVYDAADLWGYFMEASAAEVIAVEQRIYSAEWWYAGTIDRILNIGGKVTVVDIKTSALNIKGKIQVAAYIMALREHGVEVDGGLLVSVRNGEIKTSPVNQSHFDKWEEIMLKYNRGVLNAESC